MTLLHTNLTLEREKFRFDPVKMERSNQNSNRNLMRKKSRNFQKNFSKMPRCRHQKLSIKIKEIRTSDRRLLYQSFRKVPILRIKCYDFCLLFIYYAVFATNDTYAMTHSGAILQRVFTPLRFRECPFYQSFQSPYSSSEFA